MSKYSLEMDLKREICEVVVTDQILASKDSRTDVQKVPGPDLVQLGECGVTCISDGPQRFLPQDHGAIWIRTSQQANLGLRWTSKERSVKS